MDKIDGFKKLDEVLKFIINSPTPINFVTISQKITFSDNKEIGEILRKLTNDGYIEITEVYESIVNEPIVKYTSTYNGRLFIGYEQEAKGKKIKNKLFNLVYKIVTSDYFKFILIGLIIAYLVWWFKWNK